jgi:hypothetical protein
MALLPVLTCDRDTMQPAMSGCCPRVTAYSALLGCVAPSICERQLVHTHMSVFIYNCTYMGIVQWSTAPAVGNDGRSSPACCGMCQRLHAANARSWGSWILGGAVR